MRLRAGMWELLRFQEEFSVYGFVVCIFGPIFQLRWKPSMNGSAHLRLSRFLRVARYIVKREPNRR